MPNDTPEQRAQDLAHKFWSPDVWTQHDAYVLALAALRDERALAQQRIAELERDNAALLADKERLDFVMANRSSLWNRELATREAIDAARKQSK